MSPGNTYPLPLPRLHSNCPLLSRRGSLQRGRARAGRVRQVNAEGGWKTWTASPTSTGRRCGPRYRPQRTRRPRQRQNPEPGPEGGAGFNPPRSPPGGPILVASTAAVAAAASTTVAPAATAVTAATAAAAGTFPRLWADLRGTWRFWVDSPHCKANVRGPSRRA